MLALRISPIALGLAALLVTGCEERDRVLAPGSNPGPGGGGNGGPGPLTVITVPAGPDTTVPAGPGVFVAGMVSDPDGVDSVYFSLIGGVTAIPPHRHTGLGEFSFAIPVTTNGLSGEMIIVQVYGTDRLGNRGDPAERRIFVE